MLPFGTLVLNKYRIRRSPGRRDGLLGKGTFGNVYLAHEELADRDVAIKELGLDSADLQSQEEEALRRFLTEGRLGLRIRNPYILEVHAIEPFEDGYLLVMELAESGDLKQLLARGRPSLDRAIEIGEGIALGLQAAHERGIVHRDLKPGNVFFMHDGMPKVADFGVAHIPQAVGGYLSLTRTGFQPGTVIYMSPEQAAGRRIDHRSDLYSLAVILFELLTGSFYIDIQHCRELAQSRAESTPVLEELRFFQAFSEIAFDGPISRPSDKNPEIPEWLDMVVMTGLARSPDDRWQSGRDFGAALRPGLRADTLPLTESRPLDATIMDPVRPQRHPGTSDAPPALPGLTPLGGATTGNGAASKTDSRSAGPLPKPAEAPAPAAADVVAEATYVKAPASKTPAPATPALPLAAKSSNVQGKTTTPMVRGATQEQTVAVAPPIAPASPMRVSKAMPRKRPLWLFAAPIAAIAAIAAVAIVVVASGGKKSKPAPPAAVQQPPPIATAAAQPSAGISATSAAAAPPRAADQVGDAELLRPGASVVQRYNVAGSAGDPGQIVLYSQTSVGGCQRPYLDIIRPDAAGKWTSVWDATRSPSTDNPLLPDVQQSSGNCYPAIKFSAVQPLAQNEQPQAVVAVAQADGSLRLAVFGWDTAKKQVLLPFDLRTTPGGDATLNPGQPTTISLNENAYPPPSSGLNPDYGRPTGRLSVLLTWQGGSFVAGRQKLAPNCLTGKLTDKAATDSSKAVQIACPDGSTGPFSAAALTSDTSFADGIGFDDLAAGDDVTVTLVDSSLAPTDPLQALPIAANLKSAAALARKQARTAPPPTAATRTPAQPAAPQPAPPPVQPAPQPAPTQPPPQPQPTSSGGGLGGGTGGDSGGGGLGGGGH